MTLYEVQYRSMSACYNGIVEAESEQEAKRKFGKGAFTPGERAFCMSVRKVKEVEENVR